jgi:hypothetical protein
VVAQEPEDTHSETTRNKKNPGISKFGVCPIITGLQGYVGKQALRHLSVVYFVILLVARNIWQWMVEISVNNELQLIEK